MSSAAKDEVSAPKRAPPRSTAHTRVTLKLSRSPFSLSLPPTHPPQTPTPPAATATKPKTVKGAKITDLDADEAGEKLAALSVTEVGVGKKERDSERESSVQERRRDETSQGVQVPILPLDWAVKDEWKEG